MPSRVLLEQLSGEFPKFCKVGTGYNKRINLTADGFVAVSDSVHFLKTLQFAQVLVDEAHHPLPAGMPHGQEVFKFSATHKEDPDFRYTMGEAIEDGVLCDYDLTVPVTTDGHAYISLAQLLVSQAGRFRRVLAYCNSVKEAQRFQHVLQTFGLAAWHINSNTPLRKRQEVLRQFAACLRRPVHILVTVQVLGEGVNIPNADTCMFVEPRDSYVSVIQALGRVLRASPRKPLAHIVLPDFTTTSVTSNIEKEMPAGCSPSSNARRDAFTDWEHEAPSPPHQKTRASGKSGKDGGKPVRSAGNVDIDSGMCRKTTRPEAVQVDLDYCASPKLQDDPRPGDREDFVGKASESLLHKSHKSNISRLTSAIRKAVRVGKPLDGYGTQLERFVGRISQADSRLCQQPLSFRVWVVDASATHTRQMSSIYKDLLVQLTDVVDHPDPWEVRLHELERFISKYGLLPRRKSRIRHEASLAHFLHNTGVRLKRGTLSQRRISRLGNTTCNLISHRLNQWQDRDWYFKQRCDALSRYIREHGKLPPARGEGRSATERLGKWLVGIRNSNTRITRTRMQVLKGVHPLVTQRVAAWVKKLCRKWKSPAWTEQAETVANFVRQAGRLPRDTSGTERALQRWLHQQRLVLYWMGEAPEELKALRLTSSAMAEYFS